MFINFDLAEARLDNISYYQYFDLLGVYSNSPFLSLFILSYKLNIGIFIVYFYI